MARKRAKRADLLSGAFWLACAMGLCYRAGQLGLGQVGDPGPGFTIFLAAAILALLSIVLVLSSLWPRDNEVERVPDAIQWSKIGLILFSLIVYGLVLGRMGFVLTTFLLVAFLLKVIEGKRWHVALLCGVGMALGTYAVFELWLQARLPRGFLGF
jgi:putative tricarboxylic transport membrane protein